MKLLMVEVETGEVVAEKSLTGTVWRLDADGCFRFDEQDFHLVSPKTTVVEFQFENCFGDRFPLDALLDSDGFIAAMQEVVLNALTANSYGRIDPKVPPSNALK